jgi:DNA-directed RNA polymerase subunit N (RpoN/RPB10)
MDFFKRWFTAPSSPLSDITVQCSRCGEVIHGQINLSNDPSLEYDEKGTASYLCRKVLMGSGHCFQQIEVVLRLNQDRKLISKEITGGKFVE